MKIYLVRSGRDAGTQTGKLSDERLTITGQTEAKAVAKFLSGKNITSFLSSPAKRAVETADIISKKIGIPYQINELLSDRDLGKAKNMTYRMVEKKFSHILSLPRFHKDWKFPEGETNVEIYNRAKKLIHEIDNRSRGKMEEFLMVSHPLVLNYLIYNLQMIGFQEGLFYNFQSGMVAQLEREENYYTLLSLFRP